MTSTLAQRLLDHIMPGGAQSGSPSRLSVIGLCKNAGKTVTLNHLVRAAAERQLPLGLVSTGRDGEEHDAITELPKPRVWAPAGTWIATAAGALPAGTAAVSTFKQLPMGTPFGPVVIGRVDREGQVLLIGPGSVKRIGDVLGGLEAYGARLCLVDGSFDRIAAAAPAVTGRVVLAAGAAYSASMVETVSQVRHLLDVFDLPGVPAALESAVEQARERGPVSVVTLGGAIHEVPVVTALGDPEPIARAVAEHEPYGACLVLNGALGDRLMMTLLKTRARTVSVVVNDPTHILVERNLWRRWRRQGGQAYVRHRVNLVTVTTNPYSPVGQSYNARDFFEAIRDMAHRPVFDLEAGFSA
ncbi:MAG TPA: hypothetical protein VD902_09685 [Symbiobacteriaceae bacterium]|nr:hypothetical protein [Symbiobacteriaceae bacterium]